MLRQDGDCCRHIHQTRLRHDHDGTIKFWKRLSVLMMEMVTVVVISSSSN
jgi:hypothetical protein